MILYHCIRKIILSGNGLLVWIFYIIFILLLLIINTVAGKLNLYYKITTNNYKKKLCFYIFG